jgi:hypothetical protein
MSKAGQASHLRGNWTPWLLKISTAPGGTGKDEGWISD